MTTRAEIADKMLSALEVFVGAALATAACAGIARINRMLAWSMLAMTILLGGWLSYAAAAEFVLGDLRDAVWRELGWPWVLATIAGPLVPAICVMFVLVLATRSSDSEPGMK